MEEMSNQASLQRENDRINELIRQQAAQKLTGKAGDVPATAAASPDTVNQQAQPAAGDQASAPAAATPSPENANWELRYKTIEGRYKTDVGKRDERIAFLESENEALKTANAKLEGTIDGLTAGGKKPAPAAQSKPVDDDNIVARELGTDIAQGVDGIAKQAVAESLQDILKRIDGLEKGGKAPQTQANQQQSSGQRSTFYVDLDGLAAGWEAKNKDAGFLGYIRTHGPNGPGSSPSYQVKLTEAFQKQDVVSVAEIFNLYQVAPAHNAQVDIVPGRGRGGDSQTASSAESVTRSEIKSFYDTLQKRPGSISKEEAQRFEAKVANANDKGLIIDQ